MSRTGPNLVVFDIETGGFVPEANPDKPESKGSPLVEVAFICYDTITLEEVDRYEALIKPYYEHPITKQELVYTSGAMNAHGISIAEMEAKGKELKVVLKEIVAKLKQWKTPGMHGKPILAGHNILKFDIPFLDVCMMWNNLQWLLEVNPFIFDTMHLARMIWPQTTKDTPNAKVTDHQLGTFSSALGVNLVNAHRASADVEANGEGILRLLSMMRGNSVSIAIESDVNPESKPFKI